MNTVSSLEQFLENFDKQHPEKSKSQRQEIKKFDQIIYMRDHSAIDKAPAQYKYSPDQPSK